ncbi:hypothetical protein [Solimonas sp. SE-A11]|uniref:hypothetical protein n=1 Tax=Solimonas sp. SE-A11 TaxID=3054954 RepID=UPI00259CE2C0|nr:hypothetical protein [Solimonas sp. SE-A11]MDM4772380.1 hypothetical protein [Solimonas sp. SE-A11]
MNRILFPAAVCSSLLALTACGGGTGGGTGGDSFSMATKADALRELGVASAMLSELPDPLDTGATAEAKRIGDLPEFGRAEGLCSMSGRSDLSSGNRQWNFSLLGLGNVAVSFDREENNACLSTATAPSPRTATLRFNGTMETGGATLNDGSQVAYLIDQGANGYAATYTQLLGAQTVDTQIGARLGTIEKRLAVDGGSDLRVNYGYSYDRADLTSGREVRSYAVVQIGKAGAPFRETRNGQQRSFNGVYDYATSECGGGAVTVSTEETLVLGTGGSANYPVDGKLRLAVGQQYAVFDFNGDGGATLNLNGVTQTLTATEVRAVLDQSPC